jgi:homoaconitase/3-isopropylmalate dehydratase large subunit
MTTPRTLFEKIWSDHVIVVSPQGEALLYVDFNLINEGQSFLAFDQLRIEGRQSRRPQQHLAVTDHYLPTIDRALGTAGMANPEIRRVVEMMDENAKDFRLPHVGWFHRDQGIAHVIAPELGISQPGMLITCNDSHTATNGACGALAVPIGGGNQLRHVVATQTVWLKKPKTMRIALDYMQLRPATQLADVAIDRVFIGSCTNSRIEDLRAAALVLKGRRAVVPGMVSPGSSAVKRQAEAEGLDRIFVEAGLEWRDSGCSMCNGSNGELVAPGERCASTTNRNYEGRQGRGALTHIMSPAMVAAAAVFGRLADVRQLS